PPHQHSTLSPYTTLFRSIFSVINSVMLTPLPYREPDRLVMLWETRQGSDRPLVSYPNFVDLRQRQRGFEDIAVSRCPAASPTARSEEHTSELQSRGHLVC